MVNPSVSATMKIPILYNYLRIKPIQISQFRSPIRGKKYYPNWKQHYRLHDFQTLTQSPPNPYEQWQADWDRSGLPKELRYFDSSMLPRHLQQQRQSAAARHNNSTDNWFKTSRKRLTESTLDYKRRLFGVYGLASGVDPSQLFLTGDALTYEKELEKACEAPIDETLEKANEERLAEEAKNQELMEQIASNLEKMPQLIEKFETNLNKSVANAKDNEAKQQALLDEARDRFGYYPHKHDPKFIKLKAEITERERLQKKLQRKHK